MKRIIMLSFAFLLCLTLAACGCDHQYEEIITKEATCLEVGEKRFTCTQCNDSYTEEIPVIVHNFGIATVTKDASCTEEGIKSATCIMCGKTEVTETIPMVEHIYLSEITKAPTCIAEGTKVYTCSVCNDSYTDVMPTVSHKYTSTVTTNPTCAKEGVKSFTCSVCNDSYTKPVAKTSHDYQSKVTTKPTCTKEGVKTLTCKSCNTSYTEKVAPTGHDYSSKTTTSATCTADGVKTYTCKNCKETYTEKISAKGHKWVNATCVKAKYCSNCNKTEGNALGHTTQEGTCDRCGKKFSIADKCSVKAEQNLPVSIEYYYMNRHCTTVQINSISGVFKTNSDDGTVELKLKTSLKVTHVYDGWSTAIFGIQIYNERGDMVGYDTAYVNAAEGLITTATLYFRNLEPGKYTVEFCEKS